MHPKDAILRPVCARAPYAAGGKKNSVAVCVQTFATILLPFIIKRRASFVVPNENQTHTHTAAKKEKKIKSSINKAKKFLPAPRGGIILEVHYFIFSPRASAFFFNARLFSFPQVPDFRPKALPAPNIANIFPQLPAITLRERGQRGSSDRMAHRGKMLVLFRPLLLCGIRQPQRLLAFMMLHSTSLLLFTSLEPFYGMLPGGVEILGLLLR